MLKFVLLMFLVTSAEAKFWWSCDGELAPTDVQSVNCDSHSCTFVRGQPTGLNVAFIPIAAYKNLNITIYVNYMGVEITVSCESKCLQKI